MTDTPMNDRFNSTHGASLHSAKARAYLIKQHIDFDDISPASPEYDAISGPQSGVGLRYDNAAGRNCARRNGYYRLV